MATVQSSVSPLHGTCTIGQPYGNVSTSYTCGFHTGIDFPGSGVTGSLDLYSCCVGQVVYVNTSNPNVSLGIQVQIRDSGTGIYYRYCHMVQGSVTVAVGQNVDTTTKVGVMGSTGNSSGVHLHLEASTTQSWNCNTFLSPGDCLGFGNTRGTVIQYNGSQPGPTPPTPPTPGQDTPTGTFYHRLFNSKWFWSTAPGYTGSLPDGDRKNENADYIRNYLEAEGWTIESISVVIGAMDLVSTLNSAWKPTQDNESPFGLLGWRYWEFTDWVDDGGQWVADSDYTIIDNSIGRICWYRQYNLAWTNDTYTLQAFSQDHDSTNNLSEKWILYYVYNTLSLNVLRERASYWYNYFTRSGNNWKWIYGKNTTYYLN